MSVENEAWDAVEKERGNYIDKKKLIEWLNGFGDSGTAMLGIVELRNIIQSGQFDIQEDETHG